MKKFILVTFCAVTALCATSCKKSWNCVCTDGSTTVTTATYKETKFLDAKSKCDSKQADVRAAFPNANCAIK